jgi:hypothetical protein
VWDSEATLQRHLRSARFGTLAALLETAITQPHVEFTLAGGTRGLDYTHEVREQPVGNRRRS